MLHSLIFVLGGASSGKSLVAETIAIETKKPRIYLATAQAFDDEMRRKIDDHKIQRGPDWTTVEAPVDLVAALDAVPAGHVVLLDCITLWLSNIMLSERDLTTDTTALLDALDRCKNPVVVVSNEIGAGIVPENPLARRFRNAQGRINQQIAAQADTVVGVMAGLPVMLKGDKPQGLS